MPIAAFGLAGVVIGAWPAEPDLACRSNISDLEMLAARPLLGRSPAGLPRHLSAADFSRGSAADSTPPRLGPALGGFRFQAATFSRGA